jgi:hypothetical protein
MLAAAMKSNPPPRALTDGAEPSREEPSITEVNGTVARFEMAFSPEQDAKYTFGPPVRQLVPPGIFLAFSCVVMLLLVLAYTGSSNSRLHMWLIEADRDRPVPAWLLGGIVFVSGIGVMMRARMRGVIVTAQGIEARYLLALGVPRIVRWTWTQMDRFVLDDRKVLIEMWNGTSELLPPVAQHSEMCKLIESIARGKKKDVTRLA